MPTKELEAAAPTVASMKGIQKAAALLVAIGEQRAGEIFKFLGESEVEALSLELAKAQKIPTEVCRDIITEAVESVLAEDYLAEGGVDYARSVLMRSLGEDRATSGNAEFVNVRMEKALAGGADH